ncbi:uncharacterized protein [Dermacentor albipictus]|uniref:uncharacterized protein isoform X2 n=1 Tax=Dermacentor albipictus TaxID=60249 RepID=UPI0038FD282D
MARSTGICPIQVQGGVLLVASRKLQACSVSSPPGVLLASSPRIPDGFPAFAPDSRLEAEGVVTEPESTTAPQCGTSAAVAEDVHHPTGLQCDCTTAEYIRALPLDVCKSGQDASRDTALVHIF